MSELKLEEMKVLPALIFDKASSDIPFPGRTMHLNAVDENVKNSLFAAQNFYDNNIAIIFRDGDSMLCRVGVFGTIKYLNVNSSENKEINADIEVEGRTLFNSLNDVDYMKVEVENIIEELEPELTTEGQVMLNLILDKVKQLGTKLLGDKNLVLNILNNRMLLSDKLTPSLLCDIIMSNLTMVTFDEFDFLIELDFEKRITMLAKLLNQAEQLAEEENKIEAKVYEELNKEQKEYFLRKKIRIIREELGDIDKTTADVDELREKIKAAGMSEEAEKQALKELKRYNSTMAMSPDSSIIRTYLDTLLALPWQIRTEDNTDIDAVKAKLDETHSGLDKPKERILDYLAVKLYSQKTPQTILCLAGPPGTGKTTIAKSIAEALGRKFVKQSLGGVKDEAEIRGHRRTYLGALPGRIINGIKEAGVKNPVFLLDEIDKLGADYKGDPSASLLEVLDPAQNKHFMDHYLELEFDLSEVMFICTANDLYAIPGPLRDRMEIIELSSYTELEKFQIARQHAIDKSLKKNGLELEKFEITDEALKEMIKYYTLEAGARQLERCIDTVVRRSIKKIMSEKVDKVVVDITLLKEMLGKRKYDYSIIEKEDLVGVVNGLAYTEYGGDVLQIEAVANQGKDDSNGDYTITGNLGEVMKESAEAAYNWIKSHKSLFDMSKSQFNSNIHIHCPEGAVPKDGPSAGVTFVIAMLSAMSNVAVKHEVGMTGEISLRGRVLPIGGLKEKSIAAYRSGLKTIFIPKENEKDLEDIPEEIKNNLKIVPVENVMDLIKQVFTATIWTE